MPVTQMHVGLICTLLLVGTMAGMFGCMSATRCHRRFAFVLCLGLTALDAALLTVLISCGAAVLFPVTPEAPEAAGTEEVQA